MENLSHSRNPNRPASSLPKKACNGNGNGNGGFSYSSGKTVNTATTYDDVFGGPPRFGTPTLSPRLEDYCEIFAGFNGSSRAAVSSIPVLDLPLVDDRDVYFDVRSQGFDYREVFGGFNDLDLAPSYEELFMQQSNVGDGDGDSSDDAWTPEEVESFSGGTEHSGKSPCFSNGRDSYDSIDGSTEFNISYNKASQINDTIMSGGVIRVADLGTIPGYTVAVDEMIGGSGRTKLKKETGPSSVSRGTSRYAFEDKDRRAQKYYNGGTVSLPSEPFVTVSEIDLKTHPTGIPPPSRPPPVMKSVFRSPASNSRTTGSEGSADSSSPPFFDVEVDASSAAVREAMVKAEAKLKSAKELLERKRDGARTTTTKPTSMNNRMTEKGKSSNAAGLTALENNIDVARRSPRDKHGSKSLSSQGSVNSDGNDEWKEATQFVELVRTEQPRNADENSGGEEVSVPFNADFFDQKLTWSANAEWEKQQRRAKGDREDHEAKKLPKHPGTRKVASRHKRHEDRLAEKAPEERKNEKSRHAELQFETGNNLPDHGGIVKHRNLLRPEENKLLTEKLPKQKKEAKCIQNQQFDRMPHPHPWKAAEKNQECMFDWEHNARKLREALGVADNESTLEVSLELKGNGKKLGMDDETGESETKLNEALKRMEEETNIKEAHLKEEKNRREREAFEKAENEKRLKAALEQEEKEQKLKEAREKEDAERRAAEAREKAEQERKMKEREELELRVKEALEKEERNRRMREAREKVALERKMKEQEELELRLKEAFEKEEMNRRMREAHEKAEQERKMKVALEEEKERKLKEAREKEENERRIKEAREKAELEQRLKETLEQEEKERRIKELQEKEENERRAKEVQAETERKLKEALEQKEKEKRMKDAREKEENEKKLKEAIELEEKERRLIEAFERAEIERSLKEDLEQEEMGMRLQESKEGEERERTHRENQEHQESEMKQNKYTREESEKRQRDACEMEKTCETTEETLSNPLEEDEREDNHESVNQVREEEDGLRQRDISGEACPWKVFEKNLKDASQKEGTNEEVPQMGENGGYNKQNGGKLEQKSKKFESTKDAPVLKVDVGMKTEVEEKSQGVAVEDENVRKSGIGRDQRNSEESKCVPKTSSGIRNHERGSIYETQTGLNNQDAKLERPLPSQIYVQREKEAERLKREREIEMERLRKVEEERDREREREKDRMAFDQRALADARERLEKACAEARERSLPADSKLSMEARFRAERAAVERATTEARERAAEKAAFEARERMERSVSEKQFQSSGFFGERMERSVSEKQFQNSASFGATRYQNGNDGESPQRYTSRLERHRRTADRVAKALAEKNMRDLVAQREQQERIRIAETLDAEVKRWSSGKEGNIRALLSTLQYILGAESGWQPLHLTEVITSAAVKRAYRKATLCVHPDKLQQRGANIHQKYICEKVFDLLKEAWNRFNSEER